MHNCQNIGEVERSSMYLYIGVQPVFGAAGAAKIDQFDSTVLGVPKQNILRLQVAVNDVDLRQRQESKTLS